MSHSTSIFLSHSSHNDAFVAALRFRLQNRGYTVLEDSSFHAGDVLPARIKGYIDSADHVIGVVSQEVVASDWVKCELRYAREVAQQRAGYRIIPLLLPPAGAPELREIFELPHPEPGGDLDDWPAEVLAIAIGEGVGAIDALMPPLIDALQGKLAGYVAAPEARSLTPLADLRLRLRNPRFELVNDGAGVAVRRPVAEASLAFFPPGAETPEIESPEFTCVAPSGKLEAGDLTFYLERYHITPFGNFTRRAEEIESRLPEWGQDLWEALRPDDPQHAAAINAWRSAAATAGRRFTVEAPSVQRLRRTASEEQKQARAESLEATSQLLALPWELLGDGIGYFFQDGLGVRVRRSLPGGSDPPELTDAMRRPPLRVLIVCARPEGDDVAYIDHRVSVRPLTEALNALGELTDYDILDRPTFPALRDKLREALAGGRPYHVVHFDGHGVYDKRHGLGALVFEHPDSVRDGTLYRRREEVVTADRLGAELRNAGVGLFFLEACQSAQSEAKPEASVAGRLLHSGIASVAAMSHSVLVETARRFTETFYPALVRGERVGEAMLAGQRQLYDHRQRGWAWQPRSDSPGRVQRTPLELHDWFVPVLYQAGDDPVLLTASPPAERVRDELAKEHKLLLGGLPESPEHSFVGRSRELLAAERLLIEQSQRYVVLRGEGGEGKSTLAAELARWLVGTRRLDRAAFASVENLADPRAVLWTWGEQLVPNFASRAGDSEQSAEDLVVRALSEQATVLVLDNMESILPPPVLADALDRSLRSDASERSVPPPTSVDEQLAAGRVFDAGTLEAILAMCGRLLERAKRTRLVFTSREPMPAGCGFDSARHDLEIGRLSVREGMELVSRVLAEGNVLAAEAVQAERDEEIESLVKTVNGHARSLVLLTPELARRGLSATIEELAEIMADLERRYPQERQRSLFASVELSLRRLPPEVREKIAPLGVFQGGASLIPIAMTMSGDLESLGQAGLQELTKSIVALGTLLNQVGLAELLHHAGTPFLRFDPALAPALLRDLLASEDGEAAEAAARIRWAQAYRQLAAVLKHQRLEDAHLAAHLTLLELPNLLAALRLHTSRLSLRESTEPSDSFEHDATFAEQKATLDATPETIIRFATDLEALLQNLGRHEAMAEASAIRVRAHRIHEQTGGGTWTRAAYLADGQQCERLIDSGRFGEAVASARSLVQKTTAAGDHAYAGADYDQTKAQWTLGRALRMAGKPETALAPIDEARRRFESLTATMEHEDHRKLAARMASTCLTEEADCLTALGQLDAAAAKYKEAIERSGKLGNRRSVATAKFQLGTVRLLQKRFADAIPSYYEARDTFDRLGELQSVATAWHQIARVHEEAGHLEEAEAAYQKSLAMRVQAGNKPGEADSRLQLGSFYARIPRRQEEAVQCYRQAAEIYADPATANLLKEGRARNNAAGTLVALGQYEEARTELTRALECIDGLGPSVEPWKTWNILHKLETAVGNAEAAVDAHRRARAEFLAARRQGWQITDGPAAELCQHVAQIVTAQHPQTPPDQMPSELRSQLPQLETAVRQVLDSAANDPSAPAYIKARARKLLAILDGARDPALADDPVLHYAEAAELQLLLERLP